MKIAISTMQSTMVSKRNLWPMCKGSLEKTLALIIIGSSREWNDRYASIVSQKLNQSS